MADKRRKPINIGYLEVPEDYFVLDNSNKETICVVLMNEILELIDKQLPSTINRFDILDKILEASIQSNVEDEHYEVAQVLTDIKQMING